MKSEELDFLLKHKMLIIYKFLLKQGCNHHDAEDIVQDTLIKALTYVEGISIEKLNSWLFTVALNQFYDIYRKKSRYPKVNIDDEIFINNVCNDFLCENYILSIERSAEVSKILNSLNPTYKNFLILKYDMNLSYKEISEMLGMNEKSTKTYLYRARESFKRSWEENKYD